MGAGCSRVLMSIVTGVLFGLAPLLQLRERVVSVSLKEGGQRTTGARTRLRNVLVMTEMPSRWCSSSAPACCCEASGT